MSSKSFASIFFFKSGEVLHYEVFATEVLEGRGLGKFLVYKSRQ